MKRIQMIAALLACALLSVAAFAQSSPDWVKIPHKWSISDMQSAQQPHVSLTPMQQGMLKLPGSHLCGDAVTNVPCDELKRVPKNNYSTNSIGQVAKWTPDMYANFVSSQGWKELSDTDQYRIWTTFIQVKKPPLGVVVSLKTAEKGIDGSVTDISIVSVNAVCGANGTPPNYVQMGMSALFDEHGPIDGDAGGPTVRLVPDTNLAVAVQRACRAVH